MSAPASSEATDVTPGDPVAGDAPRVDFPYGDPTPSDSAPGGRTAGDPTETGQSPTDQSCNDWAAYTIAAARLDARISRVAPEDDSLAAIHARARRKLERLGRFLGELGNPERRLPVVHVTGTSGKGSTAVGIAALLTGAGLRTGLATSPYLQVATEKLQIDGRLIAGRDLLAAIDEVEAAERRWLAANPGEGRLSYGELWPALALSWFARAGVDVAVVEVGAGGRLDPTNVVRPVASVITGIGLDHLASLGPTLADIAWHKAGIIKPGAPVVVGPLPPEAWPFVAREAALAATPIIRAADFGERPGVAAGEMVSFVAANRRLALATVGVLAERGLLDPRRIDPAVLAAARLPGRLEAMPQPPHAPPVVLDGAHNPQKIAALVAELERRRGHGQPAPVIVFGALAGKATAAMLAALAPHAAALVATTAPVLGKLPAPPADLAEIAHAAGFGGALRAEPDPAAALDLGLARAQGAGTWVLMTGSLYLLGAVRGRCFPAAAVVAQRTPWPAGNVSGSGSSGGGTGRSPAAPRTKAARAPRA
jgi:dihydrofolate synthase/folylpolyglutamate synthase